MVFASLVFLFWFLPAVLLAYALAPARARSALLVVVSYVFYGWWRVDFLVPLVVSTFLDYFCGGRIARLRQQESALPEGDPRRGPLRRRAKAYLVLSLVVNLGLLAYFKYMNFGVDQLRALLGMAGIELSWTVGKVVLPVGISFYTFQSMSYTLDLYRGHARPVRSFVDFACYVALFPQLVCGPIVRYEQIAEQLHDRRHSFAKFAGGVMLLQMGLAKKLLLADPVAGVADAAFALSDPSTLEAWTGTLAYTLQIYFDFSGYSDMAIGLGAMLGFVFPLNFDSPYKARSITDFWRRWHMSLSSWLRDYLYVPLGGNRRGPARTAFNLVAVFLLCGLWHGAAWTFVVWGAWHGAWLMIERFAGKRSVLAFAPWPLQCLATFVLAMIGWVFFRADDLPQAFAFLGAMAGFGHGAGLEQFGLARWPAFVMALGLLLAWVAPNSQQLLRHDRPWLGWFTAIVFLLALMQLFFQSFVPFLYFQF